MNYRNGAYGYGVVTEALHWLTVTAIAGQFAVGLTMDLDDGSDRDDDRLDAAADRLEEDAEGRGEAALPPWAEHLSPGERRLEGRLDKLLLALLVVVPATGLLLVAAGDDWLPVHVAAQIAFLVGIAVHVGLVLSHTVVRRNRHLARMV